MTRSAAIAQAIADELAARQAVIDAGPHVVVLTIRLGPGGKPYAVHLRGEWDTKIEDRLTGRQKSA